MKDKQCFYSIDLKKRNECLDYFILILEKNNHHRVIVEKKNHYKQIFVI